MNRGRKIRTITFGILFTMLFILVCPVENFPQQIFAENVEITNEEKTDAFTDGSEEGDSSGTAEGTTQSDEVDSTEEDDTKEPEEPLKNGLIRDEKGNIYYYKNGEKLTSSWKKIKGYKYYFAASGKAVTGKKKIKQSVYYFSRTGKMRTGWKTIETKTYYFQPKTGKMVTGKKHISHYLCYFDKKGVLTRKIDKNKKMVALTYDDGPSIYTPRILKTLKDNNSVATFFVVGSRVSTYSGTIQKAVDQDCEIGNHTYDHKMLTRIGEQETKKQIAQTNQAVKKITGTNPVVMRPPGGAVNESVRSWSGMPLILWSIDTLDWRTRNAASTKQAVLDHVKDGDIVLMHDLYEATADASQTIIPTLVERGYQLVTVSELAECRGKLKNGNSYFSFRK